MGYHNSNAAYAYDMQPLSAGSSVRAAAPAARPDTHRAPERPARPRLGVLTGAAREADQAVSPAFVTALKVFAVLVMVFCLVGGARVALASVTASTLNANAKLSSELDAATTESSDLEVMRSVYGSDTRIREIAQGTLGMVDGGDGVTVDLSGSASGSSSAQAE